MSLSNIVGGAQDAYNQLTGGGNGSSYTNGSSYSNGSTNMQGTGTCAGLNADPYGSGYLVDPTDPTMQLYDPSTCQPTGWFAGQSGTQATPGAPGTTLPGASPVATAIPGWVWLVGLGVVGFAVYEMMKANR